MTVILRPLVNEKSMALIKNGMFTFEVSKETTKEAISKVVAEKFNVKVLAVKTLNSKGKVKMQRTRKGYFKTSGMKKAIVKLAKGQKIPLFEQATEEVEVKTAEGESLGTVKEKKSLLKGTKVRIEKTADKEKSEKQADAKRPTKVSQKPKKKEGNK